MWARITLILLIAWADGLTRVRRQGFIDLSSRGNRCVNPNNGLNGICIPIRQCGPLLKLLVNYRQKNGAADFLRRSVCGYQGVDPKVCCIGEDDNDGGSADVKPKSAGTPTATAPPTSEIPQISSDIISTTLPVDECGKVGPQIKHTRVVGGANSTVGAWPWMAALGYKSSKEGNNQPVFLCAGSLITDQHILTAAHCLASQKNLMMARLGDFNLYDDSDGVRPIDARIKKVIIHENYNANTFTNDIAIIVLERKVTFTNLIRPVCIPLSRELRSKDLVNRKTFVAGWGSISFGGPSSAVLQEIQIPVVTEAECKRAFEPFKTAVIDKRVLCAGYLRGGKDACKGDSGGPLMDFNSQDGLFYQIGVVSYGYKCAEEGFPGIYTRVTSFADWIVDKVESS